MAMRWAGALYVVTAFVTGYQAARLLFAPSINGSFYWWPGVMSGASILLLAAGVSTVASRFKGTFFVMFSGGLQLDPLRSSFR